MIASPNPPLMTLEEYLELEENSPIKHEYLDGHVYAMAGGTLDHGAIATNIITLLRSHLRGGPCRVYNSDVKVRLGPRRFVYPDASVACAERDRVNGRATFITDPRLVVEVLSLSTAQYDQGDKFAMYGQLDSLADYVLVSTNQRRVEVRTRVAGDAWPAHVFVPGDDIVLESLDLRVPLAAFYEDIELEERPPRPRPGRV